MFNKRQTGFTIIELLMTIVISAVLLAVGVPTFRDFLQNNRAITLSNGFVTAIHLGRTEAIRRGTFVSMCPASNTTFSACGTAANWNTGWIVFVDDDNDGVIDAQTDRVQVFETPGGGAVVGSASTRLTFSSAGMVMTGAGTINLSFTDCTGNNARVITVTNTGRVSVARATCL